ncbi:hypothetical protein [Noviluteimonas dokdonensis]|nr:hypothetical protein [Lysobacter dokdonensis]
MSEMAWSFIVQTLSGVVAVFIGIWLALVVERRRKTEDTAERDALQLAEYERVIDSILGSVVKNTAEAKRILRLLDSTHCPRLLHADLETAVWYASHGHFTSLCRNVDQRVILSQFFDDVRRLASFVDFRSDLQAQMTTQGRRADDADVFQLSKEVDKHLAALAEDLRFTGVMVITDHGKAVHKRLMGLTGV